MRLFNTAREMNSRGSLIAMSALFFACGGPGTQTGNNNENINNNNTVVQCGNDLLETGEQCDDGAANSDTLADACRNDCRNAWCGDGVLDTGEACDSALLGGASCAGESFTAGVLACSASCTLDTSACTTCGDNSAEGDEECDGNDLDGKGCSDVSSLHDGQLLCANDCTFDDSLCHFCGNAAVEGPEACDGTTFAGASCSSETTFTQGALACDNLCDLVTTDCHTCGDGSIDGQELCDGAATGSVTCATRGFVGGTLGCNGTCDAYDEAQCHDCGNDSIDPGEDCDGSAAWTGTCASETSHTSGVLECLPGCVYDTAQCYTCGDGGIDGPEQCDGTEFGGDSCATLVGFTQGSLSCTIGCNTVTTGCYTCGNGFVEGPEVCDGTNLNLQTCSSLGFDGGTVTCQAGCLGFNSSDCYVCGDGVCEHASGRENSASCPADCGWIQAAAGLFHSCGLKGDGTVWCWGINSGGTLGLGSLSPSESNVPLQLPGISGALEIASTWHDTCARTDANEVRCWGGMNYNEWPTVVTGIVGQVTKITMGMEHACALATDTDSRAYCWGNNGSGRLGNNSTVDSWTAVPVDTTLGTGFTDIAAGRCHTCAVREYLQMLPGPIFVTTSAVQCWGCDGSYAIANGNVDSHVPVNIGLSAWNVGFDVGVGWDHSCAYDGASLQCWGLNNSNQTGTVLPSPVTTPTAVTTTADVIDGGASHTCGVDLASGVASCWGANWAQQIGASCATDPVTAPTVVLVGVASVVTGQGHTCAVLTDGSLECWGRNLWGQLGDGTGGGGTGANRCTPSAVVDPYQ